MCMLKLKKIVFVLFFVLFAHCNVHAFGLGDLGGLVDLGGGGEDLSGKQTEMTGSLRSALINLTKSQVIMLGAMGLKDQAKLAEGNAKNIENGDLGTKDEVEKSIQLSAKAQEAIVKEATKKTVLDGASKAKFITSIPFYIEGSIGTVKTGKEAAGMAQSMASLSPTALLKVGPLYSIVSNLPSLVTRVTGATGQIMDFMTANNIDTSEMKSKLSDF